LRARRTGIIRPADECIVEAVDPERLGLLIAAATTDAEVISDGC
jgi:hypothetical protein